LHPHGTRARRNRTADPSGGVTMSKRGNLKVGFAPSDPPKGVKAVDSSRHTPLSSGQRPYGNHKVRGAKGEPSEAPARKRLIWWDRQGSNLVQPVMNRL